MLRLPGECGGEESHTIAACLHAHAAWPGIVGIVVPRECGLARCKPDDHAHFAGRALQRLGTVIGDQHLASVPGEQRTNERRIWFIRCPV